MKKAVLLACLTIFLFMGIQTWDSLQKNATDDETIEQAIARLIAVHEGDSNSHLGVGESLQAHKNADVIDHPQQSIVMDKPIFSFYDENTNCIGGYGWDPDVGSITANGSRNLYFSLFSQRDVYTQQSLPMAEDSLYPYADLLFRFRLLLNGAQNSNGSSKLSFYYWDSPALKGRIDFVKTTTYYKVLFYHDDSLVDSYTLQSGGQFFANIALFYNFTEQKIDLFVEGVLVHSYTPATWYDFIPYLMSAEGNRSTNTSIEMAIDRWGAKYTLW